MAKRIFFSVMFRLVQFQKLASRYLIPIFEKYLFLLYIQIKQNMKCLIQIIHLHWTEISDNFLSLNNVFEIGESYHLKGSDFYLSKIMSLALKYNKYDFKLYIFWYQFLITKCIRLCFN